MAVPKIIFLIIVACACCHTFALADSEPSYKGKTAQEWAAGIRARTEDPRELLDAGPEAAPMLIRLSENSSTGVRAMAYMGLSFIGPKAEGTLLALIKGLKDSFLTSRYWSAQGIGKFGPRGVKAVPALIDCIQTTVKSKHLVGRDLHFIDVRLETAKALGEIGPAAAPALAALKQALNDPNPGVQSATKEAIQKIQTSVKQ
ncbi:HEAT repeat domain-containing protein [Oligoflexia bacterium]|nr:HEAT repeat domain-containing protein [Oligoflexia bacterium]